MNSDKGIIFVIITLVSIAAFGYLAWQSFNIRISLKQIAAEQEASSEKLADLTARIESQRKPRTQNVRLPDVQKWLKSIEKPLAAKATQLMGNAHKTALEASVKRFSANLAEQEKNQWQNLFQELAKDRKDAQSQDLQSDKRWQELVGTLKAEEKRATEQYKRQEKQWSEVLKVLKSQEAASQKQYREVVQQLTEEKTRALARANELEDERKREIGKLLDQANQMSKDRKRQLGEFCAKRPESAICRDS